MQGLANYPDAEAFISRYPEQDRERAMLYALVAGVHYVTNSELGTGDVPSIEYLEALVEHHTQSKPAATTVARNANAGATSQRPTGATAARKRVAGKPTVSTGDNTTSKRLNSPTRSPVRSKANYPNRVRPATAQPNARPSRREQVSQKSQKKKKGASSGKDQWATTRAPVVSRYKRVVYGKPSSQWRDLNYALEHPTARGAEDDEHDAPYATDPRWASPPRVRRPADHIRTSYSPARTHAGGAEDVDGFAVDPVEGPGWHPAGTAPMVVEDHTDVPVEALPPAGVPSSARVSIDKFASSEDAWFTTEPSPPANQASKGKKKKKRVGEPKKVPAHYPTDPPAGVPSNRPQTAPSSHSILKHPHHVHWQDDNTRDVPACEEHTHTVTADGHPYHVGYDELDIKHILDRVRPTPAARQRSAQTIAAASAPAGPGRRAHRPASAIPSDHISGQTASPIVPRNARVPAQELDHSTRLTPGGHSDNYEAVNFSVDLGVTNEFPKGALSGLTADSGLVDDSPVQRGFHARAAEMVEDESDEESYTDDNDESVEFQEAPAERAHSPRHLPVQRTIHSWTDTHAQNRRRDPAHRTRHTDMSENWMSREWLEGSPRILPQ